MKKVILIVEDLPEEQVRAKEAVIAAGFRPVLAGNLADAYRLWESLEGKINGIITDLHFPESEQFTQQTGASPCGLAIVTAALLKKVPVAICSDINHHFCAYVKEIVKNLEAMTTRRIPFSMDSKNWSLAMKNLKEIMEREEK